MSMYCLHNNATYLFRKCAPLEKGKCFNKVSWERESIILSKTADVDNSTKQLKVNKTWSSCEQ